jgi:hypothetical protein
MIFQHQNWLFSPEKFKPQTPKPPKPISGLEIRFGASVAASAW